MSNNRMTEKDLKKLGLELQSDGTYKKARTKKKKAKNKSSQRDQIRICDIDSNVQVEGNSWEFRWANKHVSLNDWYSSKHWTVRNKQKQSWHKLFGQMIESAEMGEIKKYEIHLEFNSRLDPSNTITMIKLFEDTMTKKGVIIDDNKKYCKRIVIEPNLLFAQREYKITVVKLE